MYDLGTYIASGPVLPRNRSSTNGRDLLLRNQVYYVLCQESVSKLHWYASQVFGLCAGDAEAEHPADHYESRAHHRTGWRDWLLRYSSTCSCLFDLLMVMLLQVVPDQPRRDVYPR